MTRSVGLLFAAVLALFLAGCAAPSKQVPYPAFVQAQELSDAFLAGLPQLRAKRLSGDAETGRYSALLMLPPNWRWTTGASPGMGVEIYVLSGQVLLGDLELIAGNYAYLPPGSLGLPIRSEAGAELLYFLDEAGPASVIRTPLFMSRDVVPWEPVEGAGPVAGAEEKVLREDPGSGARTWLLRVAPGDGQPWQQHSVTAEGYLLSGNYRHSECVGGKAVTGSYGAGGYFLRPAGAVSGGPDAGTREGAVWLLRRNGRASVSTVRGCNETNRITGY